LALSDEAIAGVLDLAQRLLLRPARILLARRRGPDGRLRPVPVLIFHCAEGQRTDDGGASLVAALAQESGQLARPCGTVLLRLAERLEPVLARLAQQAAQRRGPGDRFAVLVERLGVIDDAQPA